MTESTESSSGDAALPPHHQIVLITDGYSTPFLAKTAISMLRYRSADVVAVLDQENAGKTSQDLFGTGGDIPIVATLEGLSPDALYIGIAPPGGKLPVAWRPLILAAIDRGIDIVSGLHEFLTSDAEFVARAAKHEARLFDVRKNQFKETATGLPYDTGPLRIHAVGQDCTVGKMVTTLEICRGLVDHGVDAQFLATGQTGIMISGEGVPIDCVVADFVNGAAEDLVKRNSDHDILLVEGQGSIAHPSFSAVTLGLLHGCDPHGLIYCYEVGRQAVKGTDHIPLLPAAQLISIYQAIASLRHPCPVIGIAMNSRTVSAEAAEQERAAMEKEFGLPVCDVYRDGPETLVQAILQLQSQLRP